METAKKIIKAIAATAYIAVGSTTLMLIHNYPLRYRLILIFVASLVMFIGIKLMPIKIQFSRSERKMIDLLEVVFILVLVILIVVQLFLLFVY